jgi:hypothetical protein
VTDELTWRSGTLGLGITLQAHDAATIEGSTDTHDVAQIDGALWLGENARIAALGTPPTGAGDANVRIGPHILGDTTFGGVLSTGDLTVADGTVITSSDPSAPGLIVGRMTVPGAPSGAGSAGVQVLATTVYATQTWRTALSPDGGTDLGRVVFRGDDVTWYGSELGGGGTVLFGAGTSLHLSNSIVLWDDTSIQLGEGWDTPAATFDGGRFDTIGLNTSRVIWKHARLIGATYATTLDVVGDLDPGLDTHELDGSVNAQSLSVDGEIEMAAGSSIHAGGITSGADDAAILGDAGSEVTASALGFEADEGTRLLLDVPDVEVDSYSLGANTVELGQDTSIVGPEFGAVIQTSVNGPPESDAFGSIVGAPGTEGQHVDISAAVQPTLATGYRPRPGERFPIVSVPAGSRDGDLYIAGTPPSVPWKGVPTPSSYELDYRWWADVVVYGDAPTDVVRGTRFVDVVQGGNWGPDRTRNVQLAMSVPHGLRILRVRLPGAVCHHGGDVARCDVGSMDAAGVVAARVRLEAVGIGAKFLRARVRSGWTDDATPVNNRTVLPSRITRR